MSVYYWLCIRAIPKKRAMEVLTQLKYSNDLRFQQSWKSKKTFFCNTDTCTDLHWYWHWHCERVVGLCVLWGVYILIWPGYWDCVGVSWPLATASVQQTAAAAPPTDSQPASAGPTLQILAATAGLFLHSHQNYDLWWGSSLPSPQHKHRTTPRHQFCVIAQQFQGNCFWRVNSPGLDFSMFWVKLSLKWLLANLSARFLPFKFSIFLGFQSNLILTLRKLRPGWGTKPPFLQLKTEQELLLQSNYKH